MELNTYIAVEFRRWLAESRPEGHEVSIDDEDEFLAIFAERNDSGNSHRLQIRFGSEMRAIGDSWVIWNGRNWERGAAYIAKENMQCVARSIKHESQHLSDEKQDEGRGKSPRQSHLAFSVTSGNEGKIDAALRLAAAELQADADDFDSHPALLNTPSGVVDLRTGALLPHDRSLMLTGMTKCDFDPEADMSGIQNLLAEMLVKKDGTRDLAKERFVQVMFGYSLRADNREKAMFVFCGDEEDDERNGNNAKSTIMNFIRDALGKDAVSIGDKDMLVRSGGRAPDAKTRLPLVGPRICYIAELAKDDVIDAASLKLITGEEGVEIKSLYRDKFEARITATPIVTTNTMSRVNDNSGGVWSRIYKILLNVFYYDDTASERAIESGPSVRIDKEKIERLRADPSFMSGVMRWLVEGAVEYHKNGLPALPEAKASLSTMRDKSDPFSGFFGSCVSRLSGNKVPATEIYNAYLLYCHENAEEALSQRAFGDAMTGRGFVKFEKGGKVYRTNMAYTPAGHAYASGNCPESAMEFTVENEGNGVTYAGSSLPESEIRQHFKITARDGMNTGDVFGPYVVRSFAGYRQMDPEVVERVINKGTRPRPATRR